MSINQGEIWLVQFYPKVGSEITKERPSIVVSHIQPNELNNLSKLSAIDCFQIKNFSNERFIKKIGEVDEKFLRDIHSTITKTLNPIYTLS